MTDIDPIKIGNTEYPVTVDSTGMFSAEFHGKPIVAESRREVGDRLKAVTTAARITIAVPFTIIKAHGVLAHGTIVGQHAGNANWLITFDDGKREQVRGYDLASASILRRLTDAECAEYDDLATAATLAKAQLTAWMDEHHGDVPASARAALLLAHRAALPIPEDAGSDGRD